jgi:hypothetical protein
MAAVMSPTDMTEFNLNGKSALGGQLGYSTELENIYLNDEDQDVIFNDQGSGLEENVSVVLLVFWGVW